jgi:photosystem II stability/assembly factor-like uncharacterized protein
MHVRLILPALSFLLSVVLAGPPALTGQDGPDEALAALEFRSIGPAIMGGRVAAIAGVPGDQLTFYFGHASGGVFRTRNGGVTFEPIFDEIGVPSIGAIAVAPSDPNVIYVGTGEGNPRNSASVGRGVWRSVDAGETWTSLGLGGTEKITRIRIHPTDPDVVYVAALGHEWGDHPDRGIFRSTDGGATWDRILYVDDTTGAADLAMDPANPRILYAAMYDFRRQPWYFRSGGPGSGLWRSADGGDTWEALTDAAPDNGLPEGALGRIGVAVAPSDADVVYAMIESTHDGQVWRSDDRGRTWRVVTEDGNVNSRPFYFTDMRVDPATSERLYSLSGRLMVSTDGGRTWERLGEDIHPDHQSMWIDPEDPRFILNGNDGGVYLSRDRGESFQYLNRVPLGQFYQIGADMRDPYWVCGGLQDNGVWCGPSETRETVGLVNDNWYIIHFGDGYYAQIDPTDWTTVYTNAHYGNIVRVDQTSGEKQSIQPYPVSLQGAAAGDHPYRFNWNSPIHLSPHDPTVVYFGSNVLHRTDDGGRSWTEISPDLTTDDPAKQIASGGPITTDNTSAEYHTTIHTISESPVQAGVVWVGTDDGLVQVTQDGGATWSNVTESVPGLPPESWVSRIDASHHDAGTAYASFDRHRLDDMAPYLFRTRDFGQTWENITADLPDFGYLHVVREDPMNANLLYVGSEFGLFASFDAGGSWTELSGGSLPPAPVNDLLIHPRDNDLIVGTHGRSIWILDDLTPLQQLAEGRMAGTYLFDPPTATRFQMQFNKPFLAQGAFKGDNPGSVATISYYLDAEPEADVSLTVENGESVIRTLEATGHTGVNRVHWALDYDPMGEGGGGNPFAQSNPLVRVPPGVYTVRLAVGEAELTKLLQVRMDPEARVTEADVIAQVEAARRLARMRYAADTSIEDAEAVQEGLETFADRYEDEEGQPGVLAGDARTIHEDLETVRGELVSEPGGYRSPAMLRDRISAMLGDVGTVSEGPNAQQDQWIEVFDTSLQDLSREIERIIQEDVSDLNRRIQEAGLPMIEAPERDTAVISDDEQDGPIG